MPKITFILPIYKVEAYLPRAIESLKNQTSPDWEAILVDDGSPDGCGALCDKAAAEDARFHAVHQANGGIGLARNAGLDAACGDYVHFYDPDDEITTDFVEKVSEAAQRTDADVIYFGYYEKYVDRDGAEINRREGIVVFADNTRLILHFYTNLINAGRNSTDRRMTGGTVFQNSRPGRSTLFSFEYGISISAVTAGSMSRNRYRRTQRYFFSRKGAVNGKIVDCRKGQIFLFNPTGGGFGFNKNLVISRRGYLYISCSVLCIGPDTFPLCLTG